MNSTRNKLVAVLVVLATSLLIPATALAQGTEPGVDAGGTRVNGVMQEGMEYSQAGAPMTNRNFGGEANSAQATLPDPDSVQEAKFETLTSRAQFATPATLIITTKSG